MVSRGQVGQKVYLVVRSGRYDHIFVGDIILHLH